jgi:outer membrane protein assembly factor BamB
MSAPAPPASRRRPDRFRQIVGLVALVIILVVGGVLARNLFEKKFPNLFDQEEVNAEQVAALQTANLTQAPTAEGDAGWPQWRGPNRDGRAPAGQLRTDWKANPPKPVWTAPYGGGYSSFAVVGGRLYTQDRNGDKERVLCLDAGTGKELWVHDWPADYGGIGYGVGPRATPTVHDGRLYAVGATGVFVCLELPRERGKPPAVLWQKMLPDEFRAAIPTWGIACSPLIEGDLVVVQPGGRDGSVAAFDRVTGERRWAAGSDVNGYSSPVAATCAGVRQVIAVTGESILGVRAADGNTLWRHEWRTANNGNIATPIVVGDYVFVSSGYGKGCVLLRLEPDGSGVKAGVVYFRRGRVMKNHHSSCVYRDGFLYGYDDNVMKCVDLRMGEEVDGWAAKDDAGHLLPKGSVILADRHLIGLTENGTLFLGEANPDEFRFLGKVDSVLSGGQTWAAPVLVDGRIYLRDAEKIVCLDARPGGK